MRFTFLLLFIAILSTSGFSQTEYYSPQFGIAESTFREAPDLADLRATELGQHFAELALRLPRDRPKLKARALLLAWLLGSDSVREQVVAADFYLRLGRIPESHLLSTMTPSAERRDELAMQGQVIVREVADYEGKRTLKKFVEHLLSSSLDAEDSMELSFEYYVKSGADMAIYHEKRTAELMWFALEQDPRMMRRPDGSTRNVETSNGGPSQPDVTSSGGNNAEMIAGDGEFESTQSRLNGLLVMELEGSEFAGGASKMIATATGGEGSNPTKIQFNQTVGPMMSGALSDVERFLSLQHDGIPRGHEVRIGFEERTSMKDGPSAAVACALLINSLLEGGPLDERFAVTGDMNVDGAVQPVGGIDGKIRGSVKADCTHVGLPYENMKAVSDILILQGPSKLCDIQVFSVQDFWEAWELAKAPSHRSEELVEAMKLFDEVAGVIGRPGGERLVTNPHVVERLKRIVELAPNHASAQLLLRTAMGNAPKYLSLGGSFTALDRCLKPMNAVQESRDFASKVEPIKDSILNLRRVRNKLDPRTKGVSDSIEDLYGVLSEIDPGMQASSPRFRLLMQELNAASDKLDAAYAKLRADPDVQEELNM